MFAKKNNGRVLLKLGVILVVLAGAVYMALDRFQATARVKLAEISTAVDAVTGTVAVDAEGGANKELKADADGKVIECDKIVVGQSFKEGDVLLRLDSTELERLIEEAKRNYDDKKKRDHITLTGGKPELVANALELSDEARAKLFRDVSPERQRAADKLEQVARLHKLNNVSDQDLENAKRALEDIDRQLQFTALDERKAAADYESMLVRSKLQLEQMEIKAPSDGEIVEASVWKGALINRGHVVGKFMSHGRVVAAKISEESFGKVRVGQDARVRLLTYGETNFDAKVSKLLPKADDAQRFTVFLDVKVESQDQLKPGSTGEVTITVGERPNAVMIARRALFDSDKVFVVKNGRVEKRTVKVGFLAYNVAEILEGIAVGEAVIVDLLDQFRDGDRVSTTLVQ